LVYEIILRHEERVALTLNNWTRR